MIKYQNLTYENNTLYQGTYTKRVIKPDSNGIYKVRHKGESKFHTLDEILHPEKFEPKIEKPKPTIKETRKRHASISKLLAKHNTHPSSYRKWLLTNKGTGSFSAFTFEEHKAFLLGWLEVKRKKLEFSVSGLCEEYETNFNSYKTHLFNNKIKTADLSEDGHRERIQLFMDSKGEYHQKSELRLLCESYDVEYKNYKGRLITRGIKFKETTIEEHEILVK